MLKVEIEGNRARILPPLPQHLMVVSMQLEGPKFYLKTGGFSFEPTHHNLRKLKEAFPQIEVDDQRATVALFEAVPGDKGQHPLGQGGEGLYLLTGGKPYASRTKPLGKFQDDATAHCLVEPYAGLFMEQGTGKSKIAIDVAGKRYADGQITGMIVFCFNGVHQQWVDEAIPDHLGLMVPRRTFAYESGKKPKAGHLAIPDSMLKTDKLAIFTINFENAWRQDGEAAIWAFLKAHRGRVIGVVDESQRIKGDTNVSSKKIVEYGRYCQFRMILTGTPYVKDLTDMWSQFLFLNDAVIGSKYKSTFQGEFCRMHPKIHGVVVGSKNEKKFYDIIAPFTFRATKEEELDLPPKVYDKVVFELHPEQRKIYDKLRTEFRAQLSTGEVVTIKHALTIVLRLQQIANGFIALDKDNPEDEAKLKELPWNPRLDALKRLRKARLGKMVTWCRFRKDVTNVLELFGPSAIDYFGGTQKSERPENKRLFIEDPRITDLVSNPAVGGTGVDGLQKVAHTAVYYSNSYNSVQRWQSEDRTHRYGMTGSCTYFDLIARNTVDAPILRNLRKKKDLSDLMLDDIRLWLADQTDVAEAD